MKIKWITIELRERDHKYIAAYFYGAASSMMITSLATQIPEIAAYGVFPALIATISLITSIWSEEY